MPGCIRALQKRLNYQKKPHLSNNLISSFVSITRSVLLPLKKS